MKYTKLYIEKAIEGGWGKGVYVVEEKIPIHTWTDAEKDSMFLDPSSWRAVGKVEKWGEYIKQLSEIEHDWELIRYEPDTAKTPVYKCKTCWARKINNIIELEGEGEWDYCEAKENEWRGKRIINSHGGFKRGNWTVKMDELMPTLRKGKSIEEYLSTLFK